MKDKLRKKILDARFALMPEVRRARSREIEQRLFSLPEFSKATTVMFYASFQSEVETHGMIRRALAEGKHVVLPRVKGKELELLEIGNFDRDVSPGAWGIPEPDQGKPANVHDIGLIVVPGAVFDERGNRVGYGAGFYDKLLAQYRGMTAALAFELQVVPQVPAAAHDVPMKKIVTETRIIETNSKS
ncbi:MAG: 5-formyltetrahydrofolate cyclo-ligase [Nitrospirae bacterium GWC2_56_14]|nr:MAG: 5-formyltetrahydrofolate cyclo-ligase [Nitrospirae bacterium GWC2_56_14]